MNESFEFIKSYTDNKSIFYHLLDGYINEHSGNNTENIYNFININCLTDKYFNPNITFFEFVRLSSYNFESNISIKSKNTYDSFIIFDGINIINQQNLIEILNSNVIIFDISFEKHSTTLMLIKNKNNYHLLLINSGKYINNHYKYKETYKPYVMLTFENIDNVITILIFIGFYLNILLNNYITKNIYNFLEENIINDFNFKINISDIIKEDENEYVRYQILNNSYYDIIYDIFNKTVSIDNNDDFIKNNLENQEINKKYEKYNHIINKIIFHKYDDDDNKNIYIQMQQSGSCTWFSKYWAICIYFLVKDPDNYYNFVFNLFDSFIEKLKEIFTLDNFKIESKNDYTNMILMNNLNLKLINLNILDYNNIFIIDIYDYEITSYKINYNGFVFSNHLIKLDYNINSYNMFKIIQSMMNQKIDDQYNNTFYFYISQIINNWDYYNIFKKYTETNNELCKLFCDDYNKISNELAIELNIISGDLYYFSEDQKKLDFTPWNNIFDLIILFKNIDYDDIENINYKQYNLYYIIKYYLNKLDNKEIIKYAKILNKILIILEIYTSVNYPFNISSPYNLTAIFMENNNKEVQNIFDKMKLKLDEYNNKFIKNIVKYLFNIETIKKWNIEEDIFNFVLNIKNNEHIIHNIIYNKCLFEKLLFNNDKYYMQSEDDYKNKKIDIDVDTDFTIKLEIIENELIFFLENPLYVINNYIFKDKCDSSSLIIKLNIYDILKNNIYKINYLNIFLKLYIQYKTINDLKNTNICLLHIQLLFFGYHSDIEMNYIYEYDIFNIYQIGTPDVPINMLDELLITIFNSINNIDKFCEYIIDNIDNFTNFEKLVNFLSNKHKINIKDYELISLNSVFYQLLNLTENSIILKQDNKIYILEYNFYIYIELIENKINKIYFNGNKILKYDKINEPFKKFIPTNCFHLIYKIDDQYNITYFLNNNLKYINQDENILNILSINNLMLTLRISKLNNFLPIGEDIDNLLIIIRNYGYNKLNFLFVNSVSKYGYIISQKEIDYNKTKLNLYDYFTITNVNNIDNNDFNLINDKLNKNLEKNYKPFDYIKKLIYNESIDESILKSLVKLRKKITNYDINKLKNKKFIGTIKLIKNFKIKLNEIKDKFLNKINYIDDIMFNINLLMDYINFKKIINTLQDIKKCKLNEFNSTLKIFSELFNNRKFKYKYLFEYIFEYIYGYEILDEQFTKYKEIISDFVNLEQSDYSDKRLDKKITFFEYQRSFGEYALQNGG